MIANSVPWQQDLLRVANNLERRKAQSCWTERTPFLVERDTMTAAYAERRLIEAYKPATLRCPMADLAEAARIKLLVKPST